jgi:nucleoside-diphosphate-sugar epimerase
MVDRSRFSGRRCVVTGGLGFIGSNLALALEAAGAEVTVLDALVEGHGGDPTNLAGSGVRVVVGDVADAEVAACVVRGADHVFDVAGQVSHLASARDPERDFALNAVARLRFLETLRRVNPDVPAVYLSTRQVYGRAATLPVDESHAPRPVDVNGIAKLAAEHLHLLRHSSVILRLSNVYGPRQHLRSDDLGVLPVFVRRALRGEPLVVFGGGTDQRDALHVDDVVEAVLAAALAPHAAGRVLNVGHDEPLTLWRIAELTAAAAPAKPEVVAREWPDDHAGVDVGSVYISSALAAQVLDWRPGIGFAEGIGETLRWFADRPERYR